MDPEKCIRASLGCDNFGRVPIYSLDHRGFKFRCRVDTLELLLPSQNECGHQSNFAKDNIPT